MTEQKYKIRIKLGDYEYEVEGDKEFVENYYLKIREDFTFDILEEIKAGDLITQNSSSKKEESISLIDFYKLIKPENHNEKIVLFAYWLLENRNVEEFQSSKHILKCYDTIKIKKPVNIHQHISSLKKEGLLMEGSDSATYKLTLHGIEYARNKLITK